MDVILETGSTPAPAWADVRQAVSEYNANTYGSPRREPLAVLAREPGKDALCAGLTGETAWGWLHIQWIWVREDLRGASIGTKLIEAAEAEALKRQCHAAMIETFSEQARRVYENCGYGVFGQIRDYPPGHVRYSLFKTLAGKRA